MPQYANVAMPDARRFARRAKDAPHEEVRTLLNILRRNVRGPDGESITLDNIAELLGVSESSLQNYMTPARTDRSKHQRGVPYTTVYALEVMASCPECVASIVWGRADAGQ